MLCSANQPSNHVPLPVPCASLPSPFDLSFTSIQFQSPHSLFTRVAIFCCIKFFYETRSRFPISSSSSHPQSTPALVYNYKASFPQKLIPSIQLLHPALKKSRSTSKFSILRTRMGDMYGYDNTDNHNFLASSTSSTPQDEISLFLRQILLHPSSSSSASSSLLVTDTGKNPHTSMAGLCSSHATLENAHPSDRSSLLQDGISVVDSSVGVGAPNDAFLSSSETCTLANIKGGAAVNMPSSSFGVNENEFDDYDCESEEGIEPLVEQQPVNSVPPRSSSKRSRAAEVHNLSEKRRRSRINEKMKALQKLIPNSNKTDKASMLDEAIEYLKQLQLQVQMLAMRNGLSLHPMCFSEDLQAQQLCQMRSELNEESRSLPLNTATTLPLTQENPLQYDSKSSLPDKHNSQEQEQPLVPSPSYTINPETSFGLESPLLPHIRSFLQERASEMRSNEILLHQQQLNADHSDTYPLGGSQVSHTFDMKTPSRRTGALKKALREKINWHQS